MSSQTAFEIPGPMTADEFYDWVRLSENEDTRYELEDGFPIKADIPGKSMRFRSEMYGFVSGLICYAFGRYTVRRGHGYLGKGISNDLRHSAYVFHDRVFSIEMGDDSEERIPELTIEI